MLLAWLVILVWILIMSLSLLTISAELALTWFSNFSIKRRWDFSNRQEQLKFHLDGRLVRKIWKRHFFQDVQNFFQWVTGIGLEPNQNFVQKKIPTNTVARAIQNFGQNGPWLAGWLSNGQNFDVNWAKSPDEEMLEISWR